MSGNSQGSDPGETEFLGNPDMTPDLICSQWRIDFNLNDDTPVFPIVNPGVRNAASVVLFLLGFFWLTGNRLHADGKLACLLAASGFHELLQEACQKSAIPIQCSEERMRQTIFGVTVLIKDVPQ
ncbi:hypothetical protein DY251_15950 [Mesorhizobium denitrificans]|uniref:Uncharacterized protein n=1 Tax=Mesorhizobium denitrificans TaxID=2294114 RepID=A0A371X9A5_9HYPH|nr:hypothetical protein DY251_15950 [Mesorhizobium denitrificans]